jgi:DNA-binding NarL/FixJ family response regulator
VLVLTMHADDESLLSALRTGARGYLVKGADKARLIRSILAAAAGQAVYGAPVARRIAGLFGTARPATPAFPDLTPREREVVELLADGARNSEIARHLGMTGKIVRNHVSAILMKLQVPGPYRRRDQGPRRAVTRPRRDNLYSVIGADGTKATRAESAICHPARHRNAPAAAHST